MDKVTRWLLAPAACLLFGLLASCGVATSAGESGAEVSGDQSNADRATSPTVSLPTSEEMTQLRNAGIETYCDAKAPTGDETSYELAVQAADATNGGLMTAGLVPDAAWFGAVTTPNHGQTHGTGDGEKVVPDLQKDDAWLLVYRHAIVPAGGGRGSQYPDDPNRTERAGSAEVTLAVIVDASTGKFLFAHSLW